MTDDPADFGKRRFYECPCGGMPIRPLIGDPKPCDICDEPLSWRPYTIGDRMVFARQVVESARRNHDSNGPD